VEITCIESEYVKENSFIGKRSEIIIVDMNWNYWEVYDGYNKIKI